MKYFSGPAEILEYDTKLVGAIEHKLDELISAAKGNRKEPGNAVLQFKLHLDGMISEPMIKETLEQFNQNCSHRIIRNTWKQMKTACFKRLRSD